MTNDASQSAFMDHPTARRENKSDTTATQIQPSAVRTWVKSAGFHPAGDCLQSP